MYQATDYYARDEKMNLNVEHILINHLKKLGYYQFNYNAKIHEYIIISKKLGNYEIPDYCKRDNINENFDKFFE